ncbi:hypothetical protein [Streptomyces chattanoogensis]|uniref:Uncharacterized protein n=1 Tax=Streptomyces chattanoogensis TaxID=66876 RepID=A0A0N0GZN9_9ACTN|nr:hypothetical protein [Streptomyces chattanoogensis]KPC62670.1 hypothetical protein ADL29_18170 [Streptomyces chattanoogensis]
MIAPDIAIRDVLIGYKTRPRVASLFNHRSGGGSIHHYLATLHARLYGRPADPAPLPSDLDELRLRALACTSEHQQEAVVAHLASQLPSTAQLLDRTQDWLHLPRHARAWLQDAAGAIRQLADQISHVSPAFALPHPPAAQPAAPTAVTTGPDPAPEDITRVLADFISPAIDPDDVLLGLDPHPRTGERFTARKATARTFGSLLHARLHGLEAASSAMPGPWDQLSRSHRATVDQQAAALAWLSGQLHSAGDILEWARDWSHWRQLPDGIHAQLASATAALHELADGVNRVPLTARTTLATTPVPVLPAAPSSAPARR